MELHLYALTTWFSSCFREHGFLQREEKKFSLRLLFLLFFNFSSTFLRSSYDCSFLFQFFFVFQNYTNSMDNKLILYISRCCCLHTVSFYYFYMFITVQMILFIAYFLVSSHQTLYNYFRLLILVHRIVFV